MTRRWLPLAVALTLCLSPGFAFAQTVYMRHATPGDAVEVFVNTSQVGAGTVDASGEAKVPSNIQPVVGKPTMDANFFLDTCAKLQRLFIADVGRNLPAPDEGCRRRQIPGLYFVQSANTLVVDVAGALPGLLLVVGKYTPPPPGQENVSHDWPPLPTGVMLSGAGMFSKFRDYSTIQCGNVSNCEKHDGGFGYAVGVGYWITRFLGAEGTFIKPHDATVHGDGGTYRFDNKLEASLRTIAGLVGGQAGPVRLYGKAGGALHSATATTLQTIDDRTVTVDDQPVVVPGGSTVFESKTEGWSWLFGGGGEAWINRVVAIYGEFNYAGVKGNPTNSTERTTAQDDRLTIIQFGVRVHIGR